MKKHGLIIADRDGTIIVEKHYLSDPDQVELIPGAAAALKNLSEMGFAVVIVTNQSAIGRRIISESQLQRIHNRMLELLQIEGAEIDAVYHCPHLPDDGCNCRKPMTGLIDRIPENLSCSPENVYVIGDKACDIELGQRVGATTLLVRTGYGAQTADDEQVNPDYIVDGLPEARDLIAKLSSEIKPG